jgi:hypothetical protein
MYFLTAGASSEPTSFENIGHFKHQPVSGQLVSCVTTLLTKGPLSSILLQILHPPYATATTMEKGNSFSGYQWSYLSSLEPGPVRSRAESFLSSVDWQALTAYAASKRQGTLCSLLPDIGLGYNHMVRILEFTDGVKWVARLRLPALAESSTSEEVLEAKSNSEFRTMSLLQQRSDLPVPRVHAYEARSDCNVKASFMLMDCLEGNVGMDLGLEIPPKFKQPFLDGLANIHVGTIFLSIYGSIFDLLLIGQAFYHPSTPDWYHCLRQYRWFMCSGPNPWAGWPI